MTEISIYAEVKREFSWLILPRKATASAADIPFRAVSAGVGHDQLQAKLQAFNRREQSLRRPLSSATDVKRDIVLSELYVRLTCSSMTPLRQRGSPSTCDNGTFLAARLLPEGPRADRLKPGGIILEA